MEAFIIYITVFVLAIFVGFEVITKGAMVAHQGKVVHEAVLAALKEA